MAKGYWLPQIDVSNMDGYKAYMAATPPAHEKYGGVALARGGRVEVVEGRARSRVVIREFPDYAAALACYASDEYQRARTLRLPHSQCDFVIVEGHDGPQPPPPGTPPAASATKGYWIAHIDVTNAEGYKPYMIACQAPFGRFGGRYLVRGGKQESPRDARAAAPWWWSSRATTRRSPAIARTATRRPRSSATARPSSISSSSRVTPARSFSLCLSPRGGER